MDPDRPDFSHDTSTEYFVAIIDQVRRDSPHRGIQR
jgi:hypothetical protein